MARPTLPAPAPVATEIPPPPVRGPRPWGGKVHNPIKKFDEERMADKQNRDANFQAGQRDALLRHQRETDERIGTIEEKLDRLIAALAGEQKSE